ncbi:hypothetical protein M5K25_003218 [Dendrobium thyrsiflorum]|uniref:Uncharacterized protein n=1 Tax=Dendrobium thyrsiflorum TaxID=117978 RepID=A0ABD0VPM7_DENTH
MIFKNVNGQKFCDDPWIGRDPKVVEKNSGVVGKNSDDGRKELRQWSKRTPAVVGTNSDSCRNKLRRWLERTPTVFGKNSGGGRRQ